MQKSETKFNLLRESGGYKLFEIKEGEHTRYFWWESGTGFLSRSYDDQELANNHFDCKILV